MRQVKFKVWDKENSSWYNPQHRIALMPNGDIYNGEYDEVQNDRLEVVFFTGILDKNGIEMYEGDIFKWVHSHYGVMEGQVKWDEFEAKFIAHTRFPSNVSTTSTLGHYLNKEPVDKKYAVIGNIYETPELLT